MTKAIGGILFAALVVIAGMSDDAYTRQLLIWIALNCLIAASLRLMLLVGELNMATGAFCGIGAYVSAIATVHFEWNFLVALLLGGVAAAVISIGFGAITLRVKGPYFILISFSFTEVMRLIYTRVDYIGGNSGLVGIFPPRALDAWLPSFVVFLAGVMLLGMYLFERSNYGKLFAGIKANESVVKAVGVNILRTKILCLVVASFAAGVAGSMHAHSNNVISPDDFGFLLSVFALAYVRVGGAGHILGPVLGTALLTTAALYFKGTGHFEHILFGGVIIFSMLFMPNGLWGVLQRIAGWGHALICRQRNAVAGSGGQHKSEGATP